MPVSSLTFFHARRFAFMISSSRVIPTRRHAFVVARDGGDSMLVAR